MGDVVQLRNADPRTSDDHMHHEAEAFVDLDREERKLARDVRRLIESSRKVQGNTRVALAKNLGRILSRFGRELSRDELAREALKTDNIKPSERLGRYQIIPGKKVSDSKRRMLSKNPDQYLQLAETAARMTDGNSNRLVLELVEGTKFDPRLSENDDLDLGPAERIAETVRSYIELISKKYHVAKLAKLLRRHSVSKTRIDNGSYEFKVDYDGWRYPNPEIVPISSTALFSVLLTSGICEWRPRGGSWTRRQIELEERIRFGIFAGPNDDVFGAFSIHPAIVYPRDRESGLPECLSRIFPQDLDRPWIESEGTVGLFVGVDDDGETEAGYEPLFDVKEEDVSVVRLPDDHGLDLTGFRNRWADRGRETEKRKVKGSKFRINRCFFSGKLDRASVGSVSKWLDQPLKSIRRRQGDALAFYDPGYDQDRPTGPTAPKHDASRGISPPDTILAEIEVSLFYDGYQGRFDEDDKFLVDEFYNWEMDDDGEMFPVVEKIDLTHDDTFLDRIEYDVAAQVNGLVKWLRDSREETVKRSDDLLKSIDDELQKLLAEEDGGSNK